MSQIFEKVKFTTSRLWPKNESASEDWDTNSCADSSHVPHDDDDDNSFKVEQSHSQEKAKSDAARQSASPLEPWRKLYLIQHPTQTLRMAFGKMREDEHKAVMQYWRRS